MTPHERAEALIEKFLWDSQQDIHKAKAALAAGIVEMANEVLEDAAKAVEANGQTFNSAQYSTSIVDQVAARTACESSAPVIRAMKSNSKPRKTIAETKESEKQ